MQHVVKAIVLDIDGVIIGGKQGVNCPYPHPDVIAKLKEAQARGIPVALCTARLGATLANNFPGLDGPHITDNGSLILTSSGSVLKKYPFEKENAKAIVKLMLENGYYTEVYAPREHYIQKGQKCEFTEGIAKFQFKHPKEVDSLLDICGNEEVIKIMTTVANVGMMAALDVLQKSVERCADFAWAFTPSSPYRFAQATAKGVSKSQGIRDLAELLGVPLENMLGVGDSVADWKFIELCGYGAAMGNSGEDFKELVRSKGGANGYVGGHVDENGLMGILEHFL